MNLTKRFLALALAAALCLSLSACGSKPTFGKDNDIPPSPQIKTTQQDNEGSGNKNNEGDKRQGQIELGTLAETVSADVENTVFSLNTEFDKLTADIDTYEKYLNSTSEIEAFYDYTLESTKYLCIRMREYSVNFAKDVMASDKSNKEKYEDFDELYDCVYDDAGDDIYDGIYDDLFDDIYDSFYDGILDDAYDNDVPYATWSEARSNEYDWWSDTRSDVYDEWSDFRSDVYDFWSDMRSELWDDDVERAEKKIEKFQQNIEKIKNRNTQEESQSSEQTADIPSEIPEVKEVDANNEFVNSIRPEFKAAMDSYEAFFDEYVAFLQKYQSASSMDALSMLTDYMDYLTRMTEAIEALDELDDDDDLSPQELAYYMEVYGRIMAKLAEAGQ